jgi:hypothetical protein
MIIFLQLKIAITPGGDWGAFGMRHVRQCLVAFACAVVLHACSASDFKLPIVAFSKSAKEAASALAEYEKTLDNAAHEGRLAAAVSGKNRVATKGKECSLNSGRCRLVLVSESGSEQILAIEPVDPVIRGIMASVATYATLLESIATAETASEIKSATDATKGNLINLAKSIDALNAARGQSASKLEPTLTTWAAPVADAIVFALNLYVESVKLQALREATSMMNEIFPSLTTLFGTVANAGMRFKKEELYKAYNAAYEAFAVNPRDRAKLDALVAAAKAYDSFLTIRPEAIFIELEKAHAALTAELKQPNPSFEQLWTHIARVAEQAGRLAEIIKALDKAANSKS